MNFAPIVPPKHADHWVYEAFRSISSQLSQHAYDLAAIGRGEAPDGAGFPLVDLTNYFYKPGLPGGQTGHGGTGPTETLTFSSTVSPSKGFIYLGSAKQTAYDETNERIGIGVPEPEARLHMTVPNPTGLITYPVLDTLVQSGWNNSDGSYVGPPGSTPDLWSYIDDVTSDLSGINFAHLDTAAGGATYIGNFDDTIPHVDPGLTTGFIFRITVRTGNSAANARFMIELSQVGGGSTFAFLTIGTPSYTAGVVGGSLGLLSSDSLSGGFSRFEFELSAAQVAAIQWTNLPIKYALVGQMMTAGTNTFSVSQMELEIPSVGGGSAEILQIWDNDGGYRNQLEYINDGGGTLDLNWSGVSGLLFTNGDASSGIRLTTDNDVGRIEVGTTSQANMDLVISGNRAAEGTLLTLDFATSYFTNVVRIAGGNPDVDKILTSTDTDGNAVWKFASELGLAMERTPVNDYEEATGIVSTVETVILTYVVAADMILQGMIVSGTTNMRFKLKVNGTAKLTTRISVANRHSDASLDDGGIAVTTGQTITITAYHEEVGNQSAEAYLKGYTES